MNVYTFCDFNAGVPQDFTDFIYRDAFPYQFCRKSVPQGVIGYLTEKMEILHEETIVLRRLYKAKEHEFRAVNEQLISMINLLEGGKKEK